MDEPKSLIILSRANQMLAEIESVDDARQLINLAEAARVYARQVELGLEAQNHAAEIKLRAQRRAGEILDGMQKAKGARGKIQEHLSGGISLLPPEDPPPTYADLGIDRMDAHRWQTIAAMPEEHFESLIAATKSADKELTTAGMYREARVQQRERKGNTPSMPSGKYRVIYADPPWRYGNTMPDYFSEQADHYPLMDMHQICELPIRELGEDNSVLFLWATSPILEEAFAVIRAWGFEYKASFIWDKIKHNMGHYNSVRHEFLLICTRGSCQPDVKKLFDSVQSIERNGHSEKPDEFRGIIDTLYPNGRRIELFARCAASGWEAWGNEV